MCFCCLFYKYLDYVNILCYDLECLTAIIGVRHKHDVMILRTKKKKFNEQSRDAAAKK